MRSVMVSMICWATGILLLISPCAAQEDQLTPVGEQVLPIDEAAEAPITPLEPPEVLIVMEDEPLSSVEDESVGQSLPVRFRELWRAVQVAVQSDDLASVHQAVNDLDALRIEAGFEALEDYSLALLQFGEQRMQAQDREGAAFFLRKALQISPTYPKVLFRSLRVGRYVGTQSTLGTLKKIIGALPSHPEVVLPILRDILFPGLWALTIGLFTVLVLVYLWDIQDVLRGFAKRLPLLLRGVGAPILAVAWIGVPCWFGPLWSVGVWGIGILLFLPDRRWLGFLAGVLLVLWAAAIPIQVNLATWLDNPGVKSMLRVYSGTLSRSDEKNLRELAEVRSDDGALFYVYGQLLRRYGEYLRAREMFLRAEMLLGRQPLTVSQRGLVEFLRGHYQEADQLFSEAQDLGLNSTEFLFNYSKIKFELLDTAASRELFTAANAKDPLLVAELQARENRMMNQSRLGLGEIKLPLLRVLESALLPIAGSHVEQQKLFKVLNVGSSPIGLAAVGVVMILWFLLIGSERKRSKFSSLFASYRPPHFLRLFFRVFPGAPWIARERALMAVVWLTLLFGALSPLVGWPMTEGSSLGWVWEQREVWTGTFAGILALSLFLGQQEWERR